MREKTLFLNMFSDYEPPEALKSVLSQAVISAADLDPAQRLVWVTVASDEYIPMAALEKVSTQIAKLYEKLRAITPDKEKALAYVAAFDVEDWYAQLSEFMGSAGDAMIALDRKEQKYDVEKHARRLEKILENWDAVREIFSDLPTGAQVEAILDAIDAPKTCEDIGISRQLLPMTVKAAKDIRDKYVLSRILWDLGILEEFAETL